VEAVGLAVEHGGVRQHLAQAGGDALASFGGDADVDGEGGDGQGSIEGERVGGLAIGVLARCGSRWHGSGVSQPEREGSLAGPSLVAPCSILRGLKPDRRDRQNLPIGNSQGLPEAASEQQPAS
jgi:hypothetical protein